MRVKILCKVVPRTLSGHRVKSSVKYDVTGLTSCRTQGEHVTTGACRRVNYAPSVGQEVSPGYVVYYSIKYN